MINAVVPRRHVFLVCDGTAEIEECFVLPGALFELATLSTAACVGDPDLGAHVAGWEDLWRWGCG